MTSLTASVSNAFFKSRNTTRLWRPRSMLAYHSFVQSNSVVVVECKAWNRIDVLKKDSVGQNTRIFFIVQNPFHKFAHYWKNWNWKLKLNNLEFPHRVFSSILMESYTHSTFVINLLAHIYHKEEITVTIANVNEPKDKVRWIRKYHMYVVSLFNYERSKKYFYSKIYQWV